MQVYKTLFVFALAIFFIYHLVLHVLRIGYWG